MEYEILGGENEIGGNKILLKHKGTEILLDFGISFGDSNKFYAEFLNPRKSAVLKDFFEMGLLPKKKGIYRRDYIEHMGNPSEKRSVDALFLSHAHFDHSGYIHFLRGDIPIYCTEATKRILQVLQEIGSGPYQEFISYCETYKWREKKTKKKDDEKPLTRVNKKDTEYVHERQYIIMKPYEKVKIGAFEVELCPVDHSLPGACAYIIYPEGARNLVYTGDIRFHGYRGELSKKFIEKAKASNPKWLLCEGTRIDKEESDDERKVKNTISNLISKTKGLVFVEHPIRDLDRVKTIFEAAKENNRNLVVSTKLAYLIKIMGDLSPLPLESLKIFIQRKGWGLLYKEGFDTYQIETDYNQTKWEIEFLDGNNATKITEIARNPTKYVVSMNLWEIGNLIDLKPENAVWIKSSCEPFTDDMKVDDKRKKEWLNHFGIRYYPKEDEVETHASGHASGPEIREMIKKIGAEEVIPIHTEHPEFFKQD